MQLAQLLPRWRAVTIAAIALFALPRSARAQGAWVNDPGSLTANLGYAYVPSTNIVETPTKEVLDRPTTNHVITLSGEYVPIENLALEVSVPFAAVRYDGTVPHTPPGKWDDGNFHYTFEDLLVGARYQLLDEPYVALTPYVTATFPMANYETIGFATGGRNLRQVHFGLSAGRSLSPLVPNLFLSGTFEFTVSQSFDANAMTAAIGQDRFDASVQIGYVFLDGDLVVNLAGNTRHQLDGINFVDFGKLPAELTNYHDPILREIYYVYGGGASYAITRKLTVDAVVRLFLHGYNTRFQNLFGVDVSWRVF